MAMCQRRDEGWHQENEYFGFDGGYSRRTPAGFKDGGTPWGKPEIGAEKPVGN